MDRRHAIGGQWLGGSVMLCLALGACNKSPQPVQQPVTGAPVAALQLATAPPPPQTYAPPAAALPPPPRRVAYRPHREHWRYLTDAYDMSDAFADTPPDYTVPYEGEYPYVWRADDGAYRVVEWLPEGARYYYYEPGADEPFLIQDPDYGYAYDNGVLAAVYTRAGAPLPDRIAAEREDYAARYYARARDLYRAAVNERRRAAYAADWQQRARRIEAQRALWQRGHQEQPGWRDWYQTHQPQQEARWAPERQHRMAYAAALGATGAAGAAYALHHRGQRVVSPPAGVRAAPPLPAPIGRRPEPFPGGNRPNPAERRAEAGHPAPVHQPAYGPRSPQQIAAERQAMAHAEQAQRQAQQAQQHQLQQAQQARRAEAQHAEKQARLGQAQQAQRRELQQAQQAQQREDQRQAQAQRAETQARARQAEQAQRRELQQARQAQQREGQRQAQARMQQAQQAQRAEVQRQAQAQRAQIHAEAHAIPPRVETARLSPPHVGAPRPTPAQHAQAPHPPTPPPAPQNHGGAQKDDRHHP